MQDALRRLSDYWTSKCCLTWQPFNTEVGAGTMNPAGSTKSSSIGTCGGTISVASGGTLQLDDSGQFGPAPG